MEKRFFAPRGTADILPAEMIVWQAMEEGARTILSQYNYKEVRTPLFEELGLFKRSLGQTSDVVNKQLLQLASDREEGYALRPEGTASIVRMYVENGLDKKEALSKFFYMGPMFRGERPQKGRLREFHQIGVEVIGPGAFSPYVDAEVVALNINLLRRVFKLDQLDLKINTLGSSEDKENFSQVLRESLKPRVSDLCEDCRQRFERNVFRILDCKNAICGEIVRDLKIGHGHLLKESGDYFTEVLGALDSIGVSYTVSPILVRGLDYYTHTVFEITSTSLGSQDAVSAGGRYNHLVSELGGPEVSAIGFALGMERAILASGSGDSAQVPPPCVYVIALDGRSFKQAFLILKSLRDSGVSSDISYQTGSMKSQMRQANKSGARCVLIMGETELANGVVSLRDMETGLQEEVSIQNNDYAGLTARVKERYL